MTIPEFLERLRQVKGLTWEIDDQNTLRATGETSFTYCPITAVMLDTSGQGWLEGQYLHCAEELQLSRYAADQIVGAADDWAGHDATVREDLLIAVGLASAYPRQD
jgi:hypothetical protein